MNTLHTCGHVFPLVLASRWRQQAPDGAARACWTRSVLLERVPHAREPLRDGLEIGVARGRIQDRGLGDRGHFEVKVRRARLYRLKIQIL